VGVSIAFLFPGQGAQTPDFLDRLPGDPVVTQTLAEASAILGHDVRELATEQALTSTIAVQVTTLVAGVATQRALAHRGVEPDAVAGLSVGAFGAAVAGGAITFTDALSLVGLRAELMERAYPHGYGMAAIVGLGERRVSALLECVNEPHERVYLANLNAPTQFAIAGNEAGLDAVIAQAHAAGARKAERLAVSVPSHSRLLSHVADELERAIAGVTVENSRIPYMSNRRARAIREREEIRADLARNVMYPVRWYDATRVLYELGVRLFVEMPPERILTDLAEAAFPDARAVAAEDTQFDTIAALAGRERRFDAAR
jgi:malonate decarboxylase epsilon subunit